MLFLVPFSPTEPTPTSILTMRCSVYTVATWDTQIKAYLLHSKPFEARNASRSDLKSKEPSEDCVAKRKHFFAKNALRSSRPRFLEKEVSFRKRRLPAKKLFH